MLLRKCVSSDLGRSHVRHAFKALALLAAWGVAFPALAAPAQPPQRAPKVEVQDPFDPSEEAHPGALVEAMYARAEIYYGKGQARECVEMLNHLLFRDSRNVPAIRLKILALKQLKDIDGVVESYRTLMWMPSEAPHVPQYTYELALYYHQNQRPELARRLFERALVDHYDEADCHFYLGLIENEAGHYEIAADHFVGAAEAARQAGDAQIRIASLYHLGLANLALGHSYFGDAALFEAAGLARNSKDPTELKLKSSAEEILKQLDQPQWFFSASFEGQFDSNLAEFPSSINATGVSAERLAVNAGGGHVGSALGALQWVESLRFFGGMSLPSSTTDAYQYQTLMPSIYVTRTPLSATPWGFKIDGGLTAQGNPGGALVLPFLYTGDFGAFVKHRTLRRTELELDAGARVQRYQTDQAAGFSGQDYYARASWRREDANPLLDFFANAQFDYDSTTDAANTYLSFKGQLGDSMEIGYSHTLSVSASAGYLSFSGIPRTDINLALAANYAYRLSARWSLIADGSFTVNSSSLPDTYSYHRAIAGAGVSVAF